MATSKKAVKKPVAKAPVKKAAPKKASPAKTAKPAAKAKVTAPAAKKTVVTKPATKKPPAKPVAKAPAKKTQPVKKAAKTVAKPAPVKKAVVKPAKAATKPVEKVKATVEKPKAIVAKAPVKAAKEEKVAVAPAKKQVKEEKKVSKPVVLPKLTTNNARKYEPEFTQSVLDSPGQQKQEPTMRYSDVDLQEFKDLILRKSEAAKKELSYLQGLITRKDDMGGDESENRYMTMEDGSISMEREQLAQMASRQIQYIDHLEKALMRIENKTYGVCRVTGKLIDKARLRAVPHATLSIEAKMGQNKTPGIN